MKRSEIKILIVEDDLSIGKALLEGLTRLGYSIRWATNPEEALTHFRVTDFQAVVIDCLLPKKNGVELALEMRKHAGNDFKIILTSGIFKDRSFSQDAIGQTGAISFLTKPFDFDELKTLIEGCFAELVESEKDPLSELLFKENSSLKEIKSALASSKTPHGYDLPLVYSLLHHAQFSGRLHVIPAESELATIVFSKGTIVDVLIKDSESYFGVLLVEMGFTSPEEVEESLASQGGKPIGQLLIDANALSPHAINIVRSEQLAIRLSKTIQDTAVDLELVEEPIPANEIHLTSSQFSTALHDWVASKINKDWLAHFYIQWMEHPVKLTTNLDRITKVKDFPLLSKQSEALCLIDGTVNLQNITEARAETEFDILKAIHYGVLEKIFYFAAKTNTPKDYSAMIHRLERLYASFESKNHFEVLGLSIYAKVKDVSKSYLELAKTFHPDKIDSKAPDEYKKLNHKIFSRMTEAYDLLKDDMRRAKYHKELLQGSASDALESENKLEKARDLVSLGRFKEVEELLNEQLQAKHCAGPIKLHYLWARLKLMGSNPITTKDLTELQNLMAQVPPEDRHSSTYFYVRGLLYKSMGDFKKAYTLMRNASAIDPSMVHARRDLMILAKEVKDQQSAGGLSAKVSRFFSAPKKRKSG